MRQPTCYPSAYTHKHVRTFDLLVSDPKLLEEVHGKELQVGLRLARE